jgi:MarR family transcriptional regulator, transcriptional regulator for hemolysin
MISYEDSVRFVNLDNSIAYRIRRLARLLRIELNQVLAESSGNLTAEQWIILLQLYNKGQLYQHELTDAALQDRANIARHLNNLETNGYIHRTQDGQDARRNLVELTDAGNELIIYLAPIISELRVQRYKGLSQEDIEQLMNFLKIIEKNVLNVKDE